MSDTAWYLGYRDKTATSRWGRWLEEMRPIAHSLEGSATEMGTPLQRFLRRQLGETLPGYGYRKRHSARVTDVLRKSLDPEWAQKSPSYYGSLDDTKRTIRDAINRWDLDPLEAPVGRYGLSRLFLEQSFDQPLEELARREARIGKPFLPRVEAPPFVPLEYPS